MELRFGIAYQPVTSKQETHLPQYNILDIAPLRRLPKVLRAKGVEVELALFTTSSSRASPLSSSHSSNIIILWWTSAVFQHNTLNRRTARIYNIALTVKDTNTGMRERDDNLKKCLQAINLLKTNSLVYCDKLKYWIFSKTYHIAC